MTRQALVDALTATISTHTLTWSVTHLTQTSGFVLVISTHTLTWSVTGTASSKIKAYKNFNSHAHVERDTTMKQR